MPAQSIDIPLGTVAPNFNLPDAKGQVVSLNTARGAKGTLIVFWANLCPFVKLIRSEFVRYANDYAAQGVRIVLINSNDPGSFPDEAAEKIGQEASSWSFQFPYLIDEQQTVAAAYRAVCTPDLFLFDGDLKLYYHGQFDAARPKSETPVTGQSLRAATDALLNGQPAPQEQPVAVGCSIKWKTGKQPEYAGLALAA